MTIILGEEGNERKGRSFEGGQSSEDRTTDGERPTQRASVYSSWSDVPWRPMVAAVLIVASFLLAVRALTAARRVVIWVLIAGFFAIVLAPVVRRLEARLRGHRGAATAIVMLMATMVFLGVSALFLMPIRNQIVSTVTDLPGSVDEAASGRGPVGHLVTRLHLNKLVRDHQAEIRAWADRVNGQSFNIARSVVEGVLAFLTIFVTAFLLLTQTSAIGRAVQGLLPHRRRAAAKRVSVDAAAAVSGYMIGNLLISLIAGVSSFVCLLILGVPNPAVFALWVAFADLIPLVGATLGAAVAVLAAFLHNSTAGIIAVVFFIAYQQFENSVLQMTVMSRTVKVNPLVVLLSVLFGVELFGLMGALLAIPLAGSVQVLFKEIRRETTRDRFILPDEERSALEAP